MNKNYNAFDIIGPVMIGPSSSHTAGAVRLGKAAAAIAGSDVEKVTFFLHGSFAKTYKGHGTDKALLAGVLGMETYDENIKYSFRIADEANLKYEFVETDLGDVHPNTVKFLFKKKNGDELSVTGSSIGGGSILITEVEGEEVEFTGDFPTIITSHYDRPGIITQVTSVLSGMGVNIAFMKVFRTAKGDKANMVVETDSPIPKEALDLISKINNIIKVKIINPV